MSLQEKEIKIKEIELELLKLKDDQVRRLTTLYKFKI